MFGMAAARIAAIALVFVSCATLSQQPAIRSITVTVTEQADALFPGARVLTPKQLSGPRFEATAEAIG